jgi:hypothetical protein
MLHHGENRSKRLGSWRSAMLVSRHTDEPVPKVVPDTPPTPLLTFGRCRLGRPYRASRISRLRRLLRLGSNPDSFSQLRLLRRELKHCGSPRGVTAPSSVLITLQVNPRYDGLRQTHPSQLSRADFANQRNCMLFTIAS